jgi:hypothetical protein
VSEHPSSKWDWECLGGGGFLFFGKVARVGCGNEAACSRVAEHHEAMTVVAAQVGWPAGHAVRANDEEASGGGTETRENEWQWRS